MTTKDNVVQMFKDAAKPIQDKGSVKVRGNHNIVGNGNTVIHNNGRKIALNVDVPSDPGGKHITNPQRAELTRMVKGICQGSGKSFQFVWSKLNDHMNVPSSKLIPLANFESAELYLRKWLARFAPKAPKADSSGLERIKSGVFAEFKKRGMEEQRKDLITQWTGKPSIKVLTEYELSCVLATLRAMPLQD